MCSCLPESLYTAKFKDTDLKNENSASQFQPAKIRKYENINPYQNTKFFCEKPKLLSVYVKLCLNLISLNWTYSYSNRYLKNGDSKSIAHVIKHANVQLFIRLFVTYLLWKKYYCRQRYKQTRSTFLQDVSPTCYNGKLLGCNDKFVSL